MKENSNNRSNFFFFSQILILTGFLIMVGFCPPNFAQEQPSLAPLPGIAANNSLNAAQAHNNPQSPSKPMFCTYGKTLEKADLTSPASIFSEDLPLSVTNLRTLIETYKEEAKSSPLNEVKLESLLAWLESLTKAHNKLAIAFSRQNNLKANFDSECTVVRELQQIKDQILYFKVQALINEKKLKQAIPFLIEITCNEPNSPLGQTAYQHLKGSGFSPQIKIEASKESAANKSSKSSKMNKLLKQ